MRITILGASGNVGRRLVAEALRRALPINNALRPRIRGGVELLRDIIE